ncbi:hypothetical protein FEM48_Zijuj01G0135300 [Ziziphus jujuba var. spinosa]|uniref:Gnk2-homologous domain-containing protein n=1 Tax=Ziziphus jujuba var. spinosa TaxID=714518 RepID=A0A978W1J5_ZIZJJ|nr:hypothetical protein FEM48_Zijuj01G0135300 [Ziziphus jujuba var. spinosa]
MYLFNSEASFLALISILFLTLNSATSQPLYHICSNPSDEKSDPNFTSDLTSLLDSLSSKAMDNSFSNESSKGLYGLFLCRGDVSSTSCQNCVNDATKQIRERCLANKTAIMWYDECMVRYSGTNFFGVVEIMPKLLMYSTGTNNSEPDKPDVDVQALMYPMITDAANSNMLFKTNESPGNNESLRRYGYEDYIFYQPELRPPQPAPQPPPDDKGKKENNTTMIVVITLSSVAGVAALFGLLYYFFFGKKKGQGGLPSTELVDTSMLERDDDNNGEVWQQWSEDKGEETIDPNLINACPVNEALRWIHISLLCVQEDPNDRPNMSSVVLMLASKSLHLPKPSKPPFSADRLFLSDQFSTSGTGTGFQSSDQTSTGVSF